MVELEPDSQGFGDYLHLVCGHNLIEHPAQLDQLLGLFAKLIATRFALCGVANQAKVFNLFQKVQFGVEPIEFITLFYHNSLELYCSISG